MRLIPESRSFAKRKVIDHIFQSRWTADYFFICIKGATFFIMCDEKSVLKEYSVKRQRETKHAS
jgi:hypothetical protein